MGLQQLLGKPRNFTMQHAYWGRDNSDGEISDFLRQNDIPYRRFENDDELLDHVVERLTRGK